MGLTPTTRAVMRSGIVLSLLSLSFLASLLQSVNGEEPNDQKFDEMIVQINNIAKSFNKFVDNYTDSYREKMSNIREAEAAANERRRRRRRRMQCRRSCRQDGGEGGEGKICDFIILLADFKLSVPCLDFYLPKTFPSPPITHTHFFVKFEAHFFKINHYVKLFKDENII